MLIRISLIVAIVAGLAVGVLNFVQVKEKITTLQANLKTETAAHQEFLGKYTKAQSELDKTTAELAQTKTTLEATEAAKVKAETDLAATTKRADKLTEDLNKTRQERDTAQQDLAASLNSIFQRPDISQEVMAVRILEALDHVAEDPKTKQLMPPMISDMIKNAHDWITTPISPQSAQAGETPEFNPGSPGGVPPAQGSITKSTCSTRTNGMINPRPSSSCEKS